jgi:hypothetical protein
MPEHGRCNRRIAARTVKAAIASTSLRQPARGRIKWLRAQGDGSNGLPECAMRSAGWISRLWQRRKPMRQAGDDRCSIGEDPRRIGSLSCDAVDGAQSLPNDRLVVTPLCWLELRDRDALGATGSDDDEMSCRCRGAATGLKGQHHLASLVA